jgi:tRNA(fMet)-specific endonuclease VapC
VTFFLLDTNSAQDFSHRRHGVVERADVERRWGNRLGICTPVLGELWAGVQASDTRDKNLPRLLAVLSRLVVWPSTNEAAEEYGRIFAALKRAGRPVGRIDIQIAAIALTLGNTIVVTKDSDLAAVPGLTVENWATA